MANAEDYFGGDESLPDEHKLIRQAVREWVDRRIKPTIDDYCQKHEFPDFVIKEMGELGALGPFIPQKYGGPGLDYISYGLIMQELERGDSAVRSAASVTGSLVMYPIYLWGTEEQKMKFLPRLAKGEIVGAYGLTEPNHGSDPGSMETDRKSVV